MKIVTVGTGMAAAEFVHCLREGGSTDEIVMVGDEQFPPYSPCVIPFFLAGEPLDTVFWKGRDFYQTHQVRALLGDRVVEVDREQQTVTTAGGRKESYDRLLYAPGSATRFPDPAWQNISGVFGFKTLSHMLAIRSYLTENPCRHAVVYGGGFIGVDAALALTHLGLQVTIVHRNTRLLSQMTDEESGQFATRLLAERTGLHVRLRTTVTNVNSRNEMLHSVDLADGTRLETALLIVATGVDPLSDMLTDTPNGVSCDEQMRVDPRVYTAGDVARTRHAVNGSEGIFANAPSAVQQARTAARHLLSGEGAFAGSLNSTVLRKHMDFPIISVGTFTGETLTWQSENVWRRVFIKDGKINGYIIIGDSRMSGYLYQQYLSQAPVNRDLRQMLAQGRSDAYYRSMLLPRPLS